MYIDRGYSFEPDLLLDFDAAGNRATEFEIVLKDRKLQKIKTYRWRSLGSPAIELDFFKAHDADDANVALGATPIKDSELVLSRAQPIEVIAGSDSFKIRVPDPLGFIAMKLRAKLEYRPTEDKDSFDIVAYVYLKTPALVRESLGSSRGPHRRGHLLKPRKPEQAT